MVTPIGSLEFVLGKSLPFALIGYLNLFLVLLVGVFCCLRCPFAAAFRCCGRHHPLPAYGDMSIGC